MRREDLEEIYTSEVLDAIKNTFPIEGKRRVLRAKRVWIEDKKDPDDFHALKQHRILERTWAVPVKAEVELKDKQTGKVIARKTVTIANIPKLTPTYGFLVKGKEYHLTNQFLLRPSIYNRIREDGSLSSEYHIKGKSFEVRFDPETRKFYAKIGGAKPDLYPILRALGVTDQELQKIWGEEILAANKKYRKNSLVTFTRHLTGKDVQNDMQATDLLIKRLRGAELDPDATKLTMGRPYTHIEPATLVHSTVELLRLSRGERKPDSREALPFKRMRTAGTIVADAIREQQKRLGWKMKNNIDRADDPERIIPRSAFESAVKNVISNSSLSTFGEQVNPLESIVNAHKTTVLGEGGIGTTHAVTDEMKLVDPSHLGFLDPLHTPEDSKAGVTLTLADGVKPIGDQPATVMWNVKEKKFEYVTPKQLIGRKIAYADQVKFTGQEIKPVGQKVNAHDILKGPLPEPVSWKDVDYALVDPALVYSTTTNLIPALSTLAAVRASMATRQVTQAVPLKHREPPLVKAKSPVFGPVEDIVGKYISIRAKDDGVVVKVTPGEIVIRNAKGKLVRHKLPVNFPLNGNKSLLDSEPIVKEGQRVKKGQPIADTNFTRQGKAALGANLTVAYMPFKGLTFEDAVVVSESAAKKLTSVHLHKKGVDVGKEGRLSKKTFQAYYPNMLKADNAAKLDDDGVIKPGQVVKPGEVLVAALKPAQPTTEAEMLKRISRSLIKPYSNAAVVWDKPYEGVVTDVIRRGNKVRVLVKTEQPLEKADKIVGRWANKGIVTMVVPDSEMPKTKEGKPVDIIMNPIGVPGRINPGQLFETVAGKVAEKTGKPVELPPFTDTSVVDEIIDLAKKHKVPVREPLYGPKTGKKLGEVLTGKQYIYKLKHMVETKATARAGGVGYRYDANLIPKGGGPTGAKSLGNLGVYAALSHGLYKNLQEMHTWKMDMEQADQLWTAVQKGEPLPAPRPTFAYNKFVNLLKAVGVDVKKEGNTLVLSPMTDDDVKKMATGVIPDPGKVVLAKDPTKPEKGGLFDPKLTGGLGGDKWAMIRLAEPMPNPVFEKAIRSLLNLTQAEFEDIVAGKKGVDSQGQVVPADRAKTVGPEAIRHMLRSIDVSQEISKLKRQLPSLRRDELDKAHKKLKYLENLKRNGLTPEKAYMMRYLPVLPPKFRPLTADVEGNIIRDGLNDLYKGVGLINKQLAELKSKLPDDQLVELRKDNYDALRAYTGLGTHPQLQYKGIISIIAGKTPKGTKLEGQPKQGYFQRNLIGARQDMSMYSTITPDPSLGLDEVGIPKALAMKTYEPFVVRKLTQLANVTPLKAKEMIKKDDPMAISALEQVMAERPVLIKRDPVLHRYGLMAFKPKIVSGKTIKIHPLVTGGFNADFDGDTIYGYVFYCTSHDMCYGIPENRKEDAMAHYTEVAGLRTVHIKDFPRIEQSAVIKSPRVVEYDVPEGILVPAYVEGKIELKPVSKFSMHLDCSKWVIKTSRGRELICSEDHSLATYDPERGEIVPTKPADAVGKFVPVMGKISSHVLETLGTEPWRNPKAEFHLPAELDLDWELGWFIGAAVGDGWVSGNKKPQTSNLSFGKGGEDVARLWANLANLYSGAKFGFVSLKEHTFKGYRASSQRVTVYSQELSRMLGDLIGKGADAKRLPDWFLAAPVEFRQGLFAGLLDTDGTVNVDRRGRLNVLYTTVSEYLAKDIVLLSFSLGIPATITSAPREGRKTVYTVNFWKEALLQEGGNWLVLTHPAKQKAWEDVKEKLSLKDFVPFPSHIREIGLEALRKAGATKRRNYNKDARSLYMVLKRGDDHLARATASRLVEYVRSSGLASDDFEKWAGMVLSRNLFWDRIEEASDTGEKMVMYDLTVPGAWTFATADGMIVWDTMTAFVPISTEAVKEAYKAFPSRNLFSIATGEVLYTPTKEMMVGLFLASQARGSARKSFKSLKEAEAAARRGDIRWDQQVTIAGKRTTVARAKLDSFLPADIRRKYAGKVLDKSTQRKLFTELAEKHPDDYPRIIDQIKDLANDYMYEEAFSLDLDDFRPDKTLRQKYLEKALKAKLPEEKKVQAIDRATEQSYRELVKKKVKKPDNLFMLTLSGTKPGPEQYRQLVLAPGLVKNPDGTINPRPILNTYSEGLNMADYWTATSGARKGIITKVQSVQEPGALTKQMMNAVLDQVVVNDDCDSDFGISMDVGDRAVLNRVLAKPVKLGKKTIPSGTIITPEIQARLKSNKVGKVVVHSPLRCVHGNDGICAKCYGLDVNGQPVEEGTNVGVTAAQSLGERTVQLTLKAFHGGGVVPFGGTKEKKELFDQVVRLQQLLNVPKNLPNAAPLAKTDGLVESVRPDPAGGWRVTIGGQEHYIPQYLGKPVLVSRGKKKELRPGVRVSKGDALADGPINPHELLQLKGIEPVQRYLTDELYKIFEPHGIDKRHVETVVGAMTNTAIVEDPGDVPGFVRGDPIRLTTALWHNKRLPPGAKKMKVRPTLRGVEMAPFDLTQDWLALLNHQRLSDTLVEAAQQGWTSNLAGAHPIPPLVTGGNPKYTLGKEKK